MQNFVISVLMVSGVVGFALVLIGSSLMLGGFLGARCRRHR